MLTPASSCQVRSPRVAIREVSRRLVRACLVVACVTATGLGTVRDAKAFDPYSAATLVYQGYQGVNRILEIAGVSHRKLLWTVKGMHHTWWGCQYQDGTTAWNNFRSYRGITEVMEYFTGQNEGDCDSFIEQGNGRQRVCYGPAGAAMMVRAHGPIVNVYPCCPAD